MYLCTTRLSSAHGSQKVMDPIGLESQMVISWHVCAGDRTWVLSRAILTIEPSLQPLSPFILPTI